MFARALHVAEKVGAREHDINEWLNVCNKRERKEHSIDVTSRHSSSACPSWNKTNNDNDGRNETKTNSICSVMLPMRGQLTGKEETSRILSLSLCFPRVHSFEDNFSDSRRREAMTDCVTELPLITNGTFNEQKTPTCFPALVFLSYSGHFFNETSQLRGESVYKPSRRRSNSADVEETCKKKAPIIICHLTRDSRRHFLSERMRRRLSQQGTQRHTRWRTRFSTNLPLATTAFSLFQQMRPLTRWYPSMLFTRCSYPWSSSMHTCNNQRRNRERARQRANAWLG